MSFGIPRHELEDYYEQGELAEAEAQAERDLIARENQPDRPPDPRASVERAEEQR